MAVAISVTGAVSPVLVRASVVACSAPSPTAGGCAVSPLEVNASPAGSSGITGCAIPDLSEAAAEVPAADFGVASPGCGDEAPLGAAPPLCQFQFDSNPALGCTGGGQLRLRRGELRRGRSKTVLGGVPGLGLREDLPSRQTPRLHHPRRHERRGLLGRPYGPAPPFPRAGLLVAQRLGTSSWSSRRGTSRCFHPSRGSRSP